MKLEKPDYIDLYPYLSPKEIKEEYGSYAYSERHIQRLYKLSGLVPQDVMYKSLFDASYAIADLEQDECEWRGTFAYTLASMGQDAKQLVTKRLRAKEDHYR
jgi:hypothetical protein